MGYRHYLYLAEKAVTERVSKMTAGPEDQGPYDLIGDRCVHEFGEIRRTIHDAIHGHSIPLFLDQNLADRFSDYDAVVTGREGLEAAVDAMRRIILENVEADLARSPAELHESYKLTLKFKQIEWERPLNWQTIHESHRLPDSWLYEYSIFNLILLHETIDWKTHELVFMGW